MPSIRLPAHPSARRLRSALKRADPWIRKWTGSAYRAASPEWAHDERLLDGEGARKQGGRWSAPGVRAAYLCESAEAALAEFLAGSRAAGIPDQRVLPVVVTWAEVRLQHVLDLTTAAACTDLGLDLDRLLTTPWRAENVAGREAEPQSLGGVARTLGLEALRVPSAAVPGAVNLVVFVDRLDTGSRLDPHGLVRGKP